MTSTRDAWTEVGDRLSALGLKLKMHVEEELSEVDDDDTWDRVRSSIEEVIDALGDAARDPAVRTDVRDVAQAFAQAAGATVNEVRSALSKERSAD